MYINNYDNAVGHLKNLRAKSPAFEEMCQQGAKLTNNLTINSLLVTPVQRLPRYKMLLEQLLKMTDRDHMDFVSLERALMKISEAVMMINEKKRDHENSLVAQEVKSIMGSKVFWNLNLLKRKFIVAKVIPVSKDGGKTVKSYVYFFGDVIIIFSIKLESILTKTFSVTKKSESMHKLTPGKDDKPQPNQLVYESHFLLDPTVVSIKDTDPNLVITVNTTNYCFHTEKQLGAPSVGDMTVVITAIKSCLANPPQFDDAEKHKEPVKTKSFFGQSLLKPVLKDFQSASPDALSPIGGRGRTSSLKK